MLKVKNKSIEKTSGFGINDEDNPDMPFSRQQWSDSIETLFYQNNTNKQMFATLYIEKKEYMFFFSAESDKQKDEVISKIQEYSDIDVS